MTVNDTISSLGPEILNNIYYSKVAPGILLSTIALLFTFLITGKTVINLSRSKNKFILIWLLTFVFALIGILFVYFFPNTMQNLIKLLDFTGG